MLKVKGAYHPLMPMSLGFPHIFEEAAAHLFGVPHRHEHRASESGYQARRGSDSPHLAKSAPSQRVSARITACSARVCLQGSQESAAATGGGSPRPCHGRLEPSTDRSVHPRLKVWPRHRPLNGSRHNLEQFWSYRPKPAEELSPTTVRRVK